VTISIKLEIIQDIDRPLEGQPVAFLCNIQFLTVFTVPQVGEWMHVSSALFLLVSADMVISVRLFLSQCIELKVVYTTPTLTVFFLFVFYQH